MVNSKDFTERLHKILKEYELSAAGFADRINVGRATISHILSGRNKPSLDFVMKIVNEFPQVDLYWLLNGKGSFPKTEELPFPTSHKPLIPQKKEIEQIPDLNTEPQKQITSKKIKRIIIFMEDGTFESYDPS